MEATRHVGMAVMAGSILLGCGDGEASSGTRADDTLAQARQPLPLSQEYTLPVPVGLNPTDLTLGANTISVNDRAAVYGGGVAAMGDTQIPLTNIGVVAELDNLWSRPPVVLRGSFVSGFVKSGGLITEQQGTVVGDPEENRANIQIVRDPIFTVTITTSDTGNPVTTHRSHQAPTGMSR